MKYLPLLLLTGCVASSHKFATIGDTDFYTVKSPSLLGPSINMVVSLKTNEISPTVLTHYGGNGALNAAVSAAGFVGGSAVFGQSLRPNHDTATATITTTPPDFIGPPAPPTTIGNDKNDRPFTHRQ